MTTAIITTPGAYLTRAGQRVDVHAIVEGTATFPVKGNIIRRTKPRRTVYQIWRQDGRVQVLGEHKDDIVSKVAP